MVPARFGRYLAGRLPVSEARFLPDDGHISLILGRAAEYLKPLAGAAAPVAAGAAAV